MISLLAAIVVSASIDSTQIRMGDQTQMQVEVTYPATERVLPLDFPSQLPAGIECVSSGKADTVQEDDRIRIRQSLTLTGWGDTSLVVRPYAVTEGGDTVFGNTSLLTVKMPEGIDQMPDIDDIKGIEEVAIWWWDITKWILLGIGCALFAVGTYFICMWYIRRKNRTTVQAAPKYTRPAEVDALEALDAIKAAKIWQKGLDKEYHTELTDVIRTYIGRRFDVHSTEKTSDETLHAMKPLIDKDLHAQLSQMLQLADFVKFAKYQPLPEENEKALDTAYVFVHETTPAEEEPRAKS